METRVAVISIIVENNETVEKMLILVVYCRSSF